MVQIKNGDIDNVKVGLEQLAELKLSATLSFKIRKVLAAATEQSKEYSAVRDKLVMDYAIKGDDGKPVVDHTTGLVSVESAVFAEIDTLNNIVGDPIPVISAKELVNYCDANNVSVSAATLAKIGDVIVDDFDE